MILQNNNLAGQEAVTDYLHYTWIFDGAEQTDEQNTDENAAEQSSGSGGRE